MIPPKLKANELYHLFSVGGWGKENALKAVELLLSELPDTLLDEQDEIKYWEEVKQELEKL